MTELGDALKPWLARQRWYAGRSAPAAVEVHQRDSQVFPVPMDHVIVEADGVRYQLVLGWAEGDAPPENLHGHDDAIVGVVEGKLVYDALVDPALAIELLPVVAPGESASHVRPIGVEQSNTSLVYDDRLILKVFRRLSSDPNPDIEVTQALADAGFAHVAHPRGVWRDQGMDLAFLQDYLLGGVEGWAMALTSLRDLYNNACPPEECGGDFAGEAERLGAVTAELHVAMASAFGAAPGEPGRWLEGLGELPFEELGRIVERVRAVRDPGASIRPHGDYHLGQTMRTDTGWFILDFEGEPARTVEERRRHTSPLKDVAGMLRSLHYAAHVALADQEEHQREQLIPLADAWEQRNREAFLRGYLDTEGIRELVPADAEAFETVLAAFELDKAVYELRYERSHRPDWEHIPMTALERLAKTD